MRVALAVAVFAGCADATGIVVTAVPVDQAVMGADTLKVFVGRDTTEVSPSIHTHSDDGRAVPLQVNSFVEPQDILLTGTSADAEFWISVRAFDGATVVGEGGVAHPLTIVDGQVGAITVNVERVANEPAFMPNCPGAGPIDDRQYIVTDLATADCDFDHDTLAAGDCDDFDPGIGATNGARACVVTDPTGCRYGTATCGATGLMCTPIADVPPLAAGVCAQCEGTSDPLLNCLRNNVATVMCDVDFIPTQFCLPNAEPSLGPNIWYEAEGPPMSGGAAQWRLQPMTTDYAFGWIENGTTFVPDMTSQLPPWPAIKASAANPVPVIDGHTDSVLAIVAAPALTAVIVDFRYRLVNGGATCPDTTQPACSPFPQ